MKTIWKGKAMFNGKLREEIEDLKLEIETNNLMIKEIKHMMLENRKQMMKLTDEFMKSRYKLTKKRPNRLRGHKGYKHVSEEEKKLMHKMYLDGHSVRSIANHLERSGATISLHLHDMFDGTLNDNGEPIMG